MKITNQAEYDAAKKTLEIPHVDFIMNAQGLRDQMLEYRRQHNIYELGDLVVVKSGSQENILNVQMFKDEFIRAFISDSTKYSFGHMINFRHATDAEIKAGRRLDLPETVIQSLGEVS